MTVSVLQRFAPIRGIVLIALLAGAGSAGAHGGVVAEEDLCVINIGFLRAHFTVYQPQTSGNEELCEDIPDVTESVFVLDYLHDSLREMQVDFRIIRDVNNFGIFANWDDIATIENLEADTEFYQAPKRRPDGNLSIDHTFTTPGSYIGIVTAKHPSKDKFYNAVFQFRVGGRDYGYFPLLVALIVLLQAGYLFSNGSFSRWFAKMRAD